MRLRGVRVVRGLLVCGQQWRSRSSILVLTVAAALLVVGSVAFASVRMAGIGQAGSAAASHHSVAIGVASPGTRLDLSKAERRASTAEIAAHRRWLRWLRSPQARAARRRSRTAFHGLHAAVAQRLAVREFGSQLASFGASPAASVAAAGRVLRYVNDFTAIVVDHRGRRLVERANVPLRVGAAPIDLRLQSSGRSFASVHSPVDLSVAHELTGGVSLAGGVGFSVSGAQSATGRLGTDNTVFFGNALTDTDASVTPTAGGVDLSTVLRSRLSPQTLRYQVQLPGGETLTPSGRGAVIERDSKPLLLVAPPVAVDAQGAQVPVSMKVSGDALVLSIEHRSRDVAYPILVDPQVNLTSSTLGWAFQNNVIGIIGARDGGPGARGGTRPRTVLRSYRGVPKSPRRRRRPGRAGDSSGWCYFSGPQPGEVVAPDGAWDLQSCPLEGNATVGTDGQWTWSSNTAGLGELTDVELGDISYSYDASNTSPPGWYVSPSNSGQPTCTEQDGTSAPNGVPTSMSFQGSDCGNQLLIGLSANGNATGPATLTIGSMLATAPLLPPPPPPDPTFDSGGGPGKADPNWITCNSGSDPVNCANGDLYSSHTDVSLANRDLPFAITRTYDAQDAVAQSSPGAFGYGWASSFGDRLVLSTEVRTICTIDCGDYGAPSDPGGIAPTGPTLLNAGAGWAVYQNPDGSVYEDLSFATVEQANGSHVRYWNGGASYPAVDPYVQATLTQNGDGTYTYTLPDQQTETFGQSGQLVSEADRYGNTLLMGYDGSGNLTSITDTAGRSVTLTHNADGSVSSATGPAGTVSYGYDSSGNLTSVTDLDGGTWSYAYDGAHRMTSETDPLGHTIQTTYDSSNRVISQTDAMGRQWSWSYPSANETIITNPGGDQVDEQFENGQPTRVTRGYGTSSASTKTMAYDGNMNLVAVTDADGHTWSYAYDRSGNRTYERDPVGDVTTRTYDGTHDVTSMTDPNGNTTNYVYQNGELSFIARWVSNSQSQTTSYSYDSNGDITSMTDPNRRTWRYGYDAYGDRTSSTAPGGEQTTLTYDQSGYLTSMVKPAGNASGADPSQYTTSYTNDPYGRPTQIVDGLGHTTKISYDANGNEVSKTDPNGNTTTYSYDADNELTGVTRADGTTLTDGYDSDGHLTSQTNGAGKTTTYTYDALGDLVSRTDPAGRTTSNAYDAAGQLISVTDPQGRTTSYSYDGAGRRTAVTYSDGKTPNITYRHDGDGHRTSMTDGTGTTTYSYDSLGRLASQTNGAGQQVSYGYDLANHLTSITYPNGKTVTRSYDSDGRLASVTDWLGNQTSFAYDANSNPTSTTFPSSTGEVDSRTYDAAGQLTSINMAQGSSTQASFSYTRDANGQVQGLTATGVGPSSETYSYSALNQLGSVNGAPYGYDGAGNLTRTPAGATLGYDVANQLTSLSQGGRTVSFGYDAQGNRTQSALPGVASFSNTYNQANQLTSVSPSGLGATLAGGATFTLALTQDGRVLAAGADNYGQLGNGSTTASSSPVQVQGLSQVDAVAAGANHALALRADGTVWAWGLNSAGQLGNATKTNSTTPVQVTGLSAVAAIAAGTGGAHSLAVTADGSVWAWGQNSSGQLGNGSTKAATTPVQVKGLTGVTSVAAGATFSLALKSDGTVWAWGANKCGQLGDGNLTASKTPVQVSELTGVSAIAAGACGGLALKSDGTVWSWGDDTHGELGNGTTSTTGSSTPVPVSGLSGVTMIASGEYHNVAVESNGSAWAWGSGSSGQLGTGKTASASTPVQLSSPSGVAAIGAGEYHTLLAQVGGAVYATGKNSAGQLGLGSTKNALSPNLISPLDAIRVLAQSTYTYDGAGHRATATSAGQTQHYAWNESGTLPLLLSDGNTSYIYDDSGLPVEQISASGTVLYYHHDQLGSTRVLTTASGAIAAAYTYDAYGNLTSHTGNADTPLRWAGQYQDASTGLYYLHARYYDPTTGQFISRDPLAAITHDPYAYAGGNPLNMLDPAGLDSQCATQPPTFTDWSPPLTGWVNPPPGLDPATFSQQFSDWFVQISNWALSHGMDPGAFQDVALDAYYAVMAQIEPDPTRQAQYMASQQSYWVIAAHEVTSDLKPLISFALSPNPSPKELLKALVEVGHNVFGFPR